jgi:O-antigen/teichoic acid export membrane protein
MSFARAFAALSGASAIAMLAQLLRGKLAALFLGPAGVGIFNQLSLAWNIVNVAGGLGSFIGLTQHGAEAISSDDQAALRRLTSTFTLLLGAVSIAFGLLGAIFAAPLSDWLLHDNGKHAPLLALLMLAAPIGVSAQMWRALLSAGQQVSVLVRTQIASEIGGAAIFAVLVIWKGLTGAVIGFLASHLILSLAQAWYIRRTLGPGLLRPRLGNFDWSLVRSIAGFGASGIFLIVLVNLGIMLVSQMLIGQFGAEANGYFANAWRIASVYLTAVGATTIGYFLPSLTRCPDDVAMTGEVNATLRFYLVILPPVMAGIMAFGEWIVWLILSSKFAPVAPLLLIMVPAEFARIATDTLLAQYVARRRLLLNTLIYFAQFGSFVGLAWLLVPQLGVTGAALAYFLAAGGSLLLAHAMSGFHFAFRIDGQTARLALWATTLLAAVVASCVLYPLALTRVVLCVLAGAIWLALALREAESRRLLQGFMVRFGAGG